MQKMKRIFKLSIVFVWSAFMLIPQLAFASERYHSTFHYVALGDSLAAGLSFDGKNYIKGYPDYIYDNLQSKLPQYEIKYMNKGVSGYTTENMLEQLQEKEIQNTLLAADLITIDIGANDLLQVVDLNTLISGNPEDQQELVANVTAQLQTVSINLGEIIDEIIAINPQALVYIMGYYNALPYLQDAQPLIEGIMNNFNQTIEMVAANKGINLVPTYDVFVGNYKKYLPNQENIHPNEAGYQAIANTFMPFIWADFTVDGWDFNNGPPVYIGSSFYVDSDTLDVYQWTETEWVLIGNYREGTGPIHELELLYGTSIPDQNLGETGQYYLDIANKYLYFKEDTGWVGVKDIVTEEEIADPEYVDDEDNPEETDAIDNLEPPEVPKPKDDPEILIKRQEPQKQTNLKSDNGKEKNDSSKKQGQKTITDTMIEAVKKNGTLTIDLDGKRKTNGVYMSAKQIETLQNKNAAISLKQNDLILRIPSTTLGKVQDGITITIDNEGKINRSLSNVYNLTIQVDEKIVHSFKKGITLTFLIDKNDVKDPEHVHIYTFDNKQKQWKPLHGKYMDGAVTVETTQISKFTVFEEQEKMDLSKLPEREKKASKEEKKNESKKGKKLPNTATNTYEWFIGGLMFVIAGSFILMTRKPKNKSVNKLV